MVDWYTTSLFPELVGTGSIPIEVDSTIVLKFLTLDPESRSSLGVTTSEVNACSNGYLCAKVHRREKMTPSMRVNCLTNCGFLFIFIMWNILFIRIIF